MGPFFRRFNFFQRQKNNSRFYILKLFFSMHDNQFSSPVTSLLHISKCCILFKMRKIDLFGRIGAYCCLVGKKRGRGQN